VFVFWRKQLSVQSGMHATSRLAYPNCISYSAFVWSESVYTSAPSPFFHCISCVSRTPFSCLERFPQHAHLLLDHWNLGFSNAQPCSFKSCRTHQSTTSTVVTNGVMPMLLRPDIISAFDIGRLTLPSPSIRLTSIARTSQSVLRCLLRTLELLAIERTRFGSLGSKLRESPVGYLAFVLCTGSLSLSTITTSSWIHPVAVSVAITHHLHAALVAKSRILQHVNEHAIDIIADPRKHINTTRD
jgi:hypothetical protein